MARFEVRSDGHASDAHAARVNRGLREFNASIAGDPDFQTLRVFAREDSGALIGGLLAETYWQWLHIESLWITDRRRRAGCGTRLVELAEAEALKRGCAHAFLDTFSFQARPFYERLGYRVVGVVPGFPPGHERYFLVKRLAPPG